MTWFPPLITDAEVEEFDSIAEVFEECDRLEKERDILKDKLALAIWALERYVDLDRRNLAFETLLNIRKMDE